MRNKIIFSAPSCADLLNTFFGLAIQFLACPARQILAWILVRVLVQNNPAR